MVNSVRSRKSKFPATLFQPLSLLEMEIYYRNNREIQRLKEAWCPYHYASIPFEITKSSIALFLAEVLYLTLREEEGNPPLFSFLFHSFQLLDSKKEGSVNFHLWFMLHYTRYLGIDFQQASSGELDPVYSGMGIFGRLTSEGTTALELLLKNPQGPPEMLLLSNAERTLILEGLISYYNLHLDGFSKLKSFSVLQELFR
jgi:DNA repair protein RecO (recombination protein O)